MNCPKQDCDGEVIIEEYYDSQGDGAWAQSYTYLETIEITCGHELTEKEESELLRDYEPDYSYLEP